jgi:hypothetical protein
LIAGLMAFVAWLVIAAGMYLVIVAPRGYRSDFFFRYNACRLFLLQGKGLYSEEVSYNTSMQAWGHPPVLPLEDGFAYPPQTVLVIWPFCLLPWPIAASLWCGLQVILLVCAVILLRPRLLLAMTLLAVFYRPAMITATFGQFGILIIFLWALALYMYRARRCHVAGVLVAFTSIRPEMFALPALAAFVLMKELRRALLATLVFFYIAVALFWGLSWPLKYMAVLGAYAASFSPGWTVSRAPLVGLLAAAALVMAVYGERDADKIIVTCLALSVVLVPMTNDYNLVATLPFAVMLWQESYIAVAAWWIVSWVAWFGGLPDIILSGAVAAVLSLWHTLARLKRTHPHYLR